jgi:hypothetical protein
MLPHFPRMRRLGAWLSPCFDSAEAVVPGSQLSQSRTFKSEPSLARLPLPAHATGFPHRDGKAVRKTRAIHPTTDRPAFAASRRWSSSRAASSSCRTSSRTRDGGSNMFFRDSAGAFAEPALIGCASEAYFNIARPSRRSPARSPYTKYCPRVLLPCQRSTTPSRGETSSSSASTWNETSFT